MTKVVHDTDVGTGLEIVGGKVNVAASQATDAEVAAAIAAALGGGGGTEPNLVYTNTTNPNSSTIFDDENPPVANDDALKQNSQYLYVSSDGAQWTWNGTAYVSSTPNYVFGVGSSITINRVMPASTAGTMLSSTTTGLLEFEGLKLDIKWHTVNYGEPWLINTTTAPISIASATALDFSNIEAQIVTIAAGAGVALPSYVAIPWATTSFRLFKAHVIIGNSKLYRIEILALPLGTGRNIFMTITRIK